MRRYMAFLAALLFSICTALAVTADAVTLDATRTVLPNGLVLLHSERSHLPLVKAVLLVRSGAARDPVEKQGLASITASMLTEGTRDLTSDEFSKELDFIGASIGASASHDTMSVSLSVLSKDIEKGFRLFAGAIRKPAFRSEELKRIKKLQLDSLLSMKEDPDFIASRAFTEKVFGSHPYARYSGGTPESIRSIRRKDLKAFHREHFTPGNSILAVVGDIGREELDSLIERYFGDWEGRDPGLDPLPEPAPGGPSRVLKDMDISQANIFLGHLGIERSHPDYYPVQVMNYSLGGGGFSSRLMDRVRDELGLAYDIRSVFIPYMRSGLFYVNVQTANENAPKVLGEIRGIIDKVRKEGVTAEELEAAKAYLTGSFPRRLDTMGKLAGLLVSVEYFGLGLDYPEKYIAAVNAVTLEDTREAARRHIRPGDFVLSVAGRIEATGLEEDREAK